MRAADIQWEPEVHKDDVSPLSSVDGKESVEIYLIPQKIL